MDIRLIDANALSKAFSFATLDCLGMEPSVNVYEIQEMIKQQPTVKAIPVEWLKEFDDTFDNVLPIGCALRSWEEEQDYFKRGAIRSDGEDY